MDEADSPDAAKASGQSEKPKKTAKRAPRTRTPRPSRSTRTKRGAAAADAPELPLAEHGGSPVERSVGESPAPASAPEPAAERRSTESAERNEGGDESHRSERQQPREEREERRNEQREPAAEPDDRRRDAAEAPNDSGSRSEAPASPAAEAPASPAHHGEPRHGGGDQRHGGGDQRHGGGDEREPWWKRKKDKKKNKWSKPGGERPPAQPLPPGSAPVHTGDLPNPARFADLAALDASAQAAQQSTAEPIRLHELYALHLAELAQRGRAVGAQLEGVPSRRQWLDAIFRAAGEQQRPMVDHGWIDLTDDGHGFVVHEHVAYRLYPENTYLPESLIKRYGLKRGHVVDVWVQPPQPGERCPSVIGIRSVMGRDPNTIAAITPFEELTPYYPLQRILMEATEVHRDISMRAVDLLTPIGFGQRGLIVAPPRTGKTVLLQNMANSVSHNFPEAKLILLLIDERPEEVTDFKRHTKGEVVSSTFDESPTNHVHAAEMVIEKARRLVELGEHVVILLDSITRLARAYNALASNSGKIMSGGIEATALQKPKRFFGSARNIEGGGSLTILGTALIDTGSRMDEVIFEEFKGTGNMELHLDRGLSDKRIFPAINIDRSGTRKEELIYHPEEMARVYGLRRAMQGIPPVEAMEMFITRLKKTKTNAEFLMSLNR